MRRCRELAISSPIEDVRILAAEYVSFREWAVHELGRFPSEIEFELEKEAAREIRSEQDSEISKLRQRHDDLMSRLQSAENLIAALVARFAPRPPPTNVGEHN